MNIIGVISAGQRMWCKQSAILKTESLFEVGVNE
jgi:hypothetical protein